MAGVSRDRLTTRVADVATHDLARPTGVGRALATYEILIEGRDEWLAAARRLA
jgi:hypothetical protein